ncbi:MAG: hypothetical protein Q8S55_14730 [Methylococcaceae bacterium]|nr:hypothetical protein [Methylococcaceae bacterium]
MSYCDVYIGELNDACVYKDGVRHIANTPSRKSQFFPPTTPRPFSQYFNWIGVNGCESKKTDWAASVSIVTKAQIENFISFCYLNDASYSDPAKMLTWEGQPYLVNQLLELRVFVASLDANELYALVACET